MLQRIWHFPSCCPASRWLAPNQQENAVAFGEFLEFLKPFEEDQPCIVDERAIAKSASLLDWILNMIRWVCLLVKDILTDLVTFRLQQNSVEQNIRHLQAAELSQGIVVKDGLTASTSSSDEGNVSVSMSFRKGIVCVPIKQRRKHTRSKSKTG